MYQVQFLKNSIQEIDFMLNKRQGKTFLICRMLIQDLFMLINIESVLLALRS